MLTIYSCAGIKRFETPINIGSKRERNLMGDDYVKIIFSTATPVRFELGDYCDIPDVGRFELCTPCQPTFNTETGGYDYELQLDAQYIKWRSKILKYAPDYGASETSFTLTATPQVHLELILANVNSLGKLSAKYLFNGDLEWKPSIDNTFDHSAKTITYEGVNILDALAQLAETYEVEWWVEENYVHLGTCENGVYVDLVEHGNVTPVTRSDSQEELASRLIIYGGERNIPERYRKVLLFAVTDTDNGGRRIWDNNRVLDPEWFPETMRKYVGSEKRQVDAIPTITQRVYSENASDVLIGYIQPYLTDVEAGTWNLEVSGFQPTVYIADRENHCDTILAKLWIYGYTASGGQVDALLQETSVYMYAQGVENRQTFSFANTQITLSQDVTKLYFRVEFYARLGARAAVTASVSPGSTSKIAISKPDGRYRIEGITIDVVNASGDVTDTFSNVILNPDYSEEYHGANVLELPEGATMAVGQRYTIREILAYKVKSSYFTSKQNAFHIDSSVIVKGIVTNRLLLPESYGQSYIDCSENLDVDKSVEKVVVFEEIYPKAICEVTSVSTTPRKETLPNDDASTTVNTYLAYCIKDNVFTKEHPFQEEYRIPNQTLEITFRDGKRYEEGDDIPAGKSIGDLVNPESGKLNGWTFEVNFERDSDGSTIWEIIRDNNSYIPDENYHPVEGDTFVITGCDISVVDEVYVDLAEKELLDTAKRYAEKYNVDPSTYSCTVVPRYAQGGLVLGMGRRVNLVSSTYFVISVDENQRSWGRKSRVIGVSYPLDKPYDNPVYTIGEKPKYTRFGAIEDKIKGLSWTMQNVDAVLGGSSSGGVGYNLIRTLDDTPASDSNVYSALRSKYEFLNKIADDIAQGHITFNKGLTAVGDALFQGDTTFGAFVRSLFAGSGALIDSKGNAEFESVRVRRYLEAAELIINRLSAIEGDQLFTESDTIERVDDLGITSENIHCYRLWFKSKWDGYFTAQAPNNILKGIVNTLSGNPVNEYANGRDPNTDYYTSWMKVLSVNTAANSAEVSLYPDVEVPGGRNFAPCAMMKVARWGSCDGGDPVRTRSFYLSTTEGRFVMLSGVTSPILEDANYAAIFGLMPEFVQNMEGVNITPTQPYVYVRGLLAQEMKQIDYQGLPICQIVDRGIYDPQQTYYFRAQNPDTKVWEISDVWYMGCRYRCCYNEPSDAPSWGSTHWAMIEGNPDFTVDFAETETLYDPDNFAATLTIVARLYNQDITAAIQPADVAWTRYSEDAAGVERVYDDTIWTQAHGGSGLSITLTAADCGFNGYMPRTLRFTATVTLRDGAGEAAATESASFEL